MKYIDAYNRERIASFSLPMMLVVVFYALILIGTFATANPYNKNTNAYRATPEQVQEYLPHNDNTKQKTRNNAMHLKTFQV